VNFSSMNLLLSSDINSIDIALKSESQGEYDQLMAYYNRYIKRLPHYQIEEKGLDDIHWFYNLENQLVKIFGEDSYIEKNEDEDKIRVQRNTEQWRVKEKHPPRCKVWI